MIQYIKTKVDKKRILGETHLLYRLATNLLGLLPHRSWLISSLFICSLLSACALTRSPRLAEPEPFKPNTTSISEPFRSALSLVPLNLDPKQVELESSALAPANQGQSLADIDMSSDKPLPLVYLFKVSEPTRTEFKFPSKPVMLAAMKSCGKISDQSHNEGYVRQLFVGWKGAQGVAVRSLEIQGQKVAIAKGRGDVSGSPVSLLALTRRSEKCVYDLTIWSEDQALLEISSEGLTALGTILIMSQG